MSVNGNDKRMEDFIRTVSDVKGKLDNGDLLKKEDLSEIKKRVDELEKGYSVLDKESAINIEKRAQIYQQMERLERMVEEHKEAIDSKDDKRKEIFEKIIFSAIGAIISLVVSKIV